MELMKHITAWIPHMIEEVTMYPNNKLKWKPQGKSWGEFVEIKNKLKGSLEFYQL